MGMFDSVMVPCPQCGEEHEAQSKSGLCCLDFYPLKDAPDVTLADVNRHAPFTCAKCACVFQVNIHMRITQSVDGAYKTQPPPFQDRTESFIKKLDDLCKQHDVNVTGLIIGNGYRHAPHGPPVDDDWFANAPRTGKLCSVCRGPQVSTPSGDTCENGHGGADGIDP